MSVSDETVELLALYRLGVPTELLATWFDTTPGTIRRLASDHKVKRPLDADRKMLNRVARTERIRGHIEAYPNVSLFSSMEKAA